MSTGDVLSRNLYSKEEKYGFSTLVISSIQELIIICEASKIFFSGVMPGMTHGTAQTLQHLSLSEKCLKFRSKQALQFLQVNLSCEEN
jgi:hypothetical protein